jgi:hypothetical protein
MRLSCVRPPKELHKNPATPGTTCHLLKRRWCNLICGTFAGHPYLSLRFFAALHLFREFDTKLEVSANSRLRELWFIK